jgi:polyhydroxybutyrate depolymerase
MVRRLAVLLAAVLLAAACSAPSSAAPQGFTTGSTIHALSFGSAQQAERAYGWDQLADSAKFVVAYRDGVGRAWNVGGCCGQPGRDHIDDVGFIDAVVNVDGGGHV